MKTPLRILHLEDNRSDAELVQALLEQEGLEVAVRRVDTRGDFELALEQDVFDVILSDFSLPSFDGRAALELVRRKQIGVPFIFVSGTLGEEAAVESLQNGAADYVLKDRLPRLATAVRRAIQDAKERDERQRIQEELRHRDELFRKITECVEDVITVLDLEGNRLFDSRMRHRTPQTLPPALPTSVFDEIHPDDRDQVRIIFENSVATGSGYRAEYRILDPDGNICEVEAQASVIREASGNIIHMLAVTRDVTSRKATERALQAAEARYRTLVEQSAVGICTLQHGTILYANPKMAEMLACHVSDLVPRSFLELVLNEDRADAQAKFSQPEADTAQLASCDIRMQRKDGRVIYVEAHACVTDYYGEPALIGALHDITERKELEERLLRTQRLESIGALAGGIAHDLNNMLTPIFMATELLRSNPTPEESEKMLETIHESATRGSELVRQVLSFARGVSGQPTVLQLDHLAREMVKLITGTFPRSIRIQTRFAGRLHPIIGDATQLHQVLLNLCVNSRDAMPNGGTLLIEARNVEMYNKTTPSHPEPVSGSFVELSVSDTGLGIPLNLQDRIFEPFFSTKAAGKGTGLGLSTVSGIVKEHGGLIEVTSQPGQGARFTVYFPSVATAHPAPSVERAAELPSGKGEQILLVEDERAVLEMTKGTLESFGYNVLIANHGGEAMVLYAQLQSSIAAVVTDLMMPVMDGPALVRWVRNQNPEAKIICSSGVASESKLREFDKSQVNGFLMKPYTTGQLLRTLHDVLTA